MRPNVAARTTCCSPPTRPTASSGSATPRPRARSPARRPEQRRCPADVDEALVDDRVSQRVRGRRSRPHRGAATTAPGDRGHAAGVRPARQRSPRGATSVHVEDNRARYAAKRAIFLDLFARHGVRVAGSEGDLLPVGSRCPARRRRSSGRSSSSTGQTSWSRRGRSSGRKARGSCGSRWSRRSRSASGRRAALDDLRRGLRVIDVLEAGADRAPLGRPPRPTPSAPIDARRRGDDRAPRPGVRPRRRAGRAPTALAGEHLGEAGGPALLPCPRARDDRGRTVRVSRQASAEARLRVAGRPGRPTRDGSLRGAPRTRGRADAELREHRRVRGRRNDGRHVGHGRLMRADRCECPSLRRGRDRRASSSPCRRRRS